MSVGQSKFVVLFVVDSSQKSSGASEVEPTDSNEVNVLVQVFGDENSGFVFQVDTSVTSPA